MLATSLSLSLAPATADVDAATLRRIPPTPAREPVESGSYTNPLPVEVADPCVLRHAGGYYLYGTSEPSRGFRVWSSDDLVHWEAHPLAFAKTRTSWARDHFWAPCVVEHAGAFYLYYNAVGPVGRGGDGRGGRMSHRICVARSDSPLGPFVDVKAPLLDVGSACIDAEVFVDGDGRGYLYYSKDISENPVSEIFVVPLSADLLDVAGEPVACVRPSQEWEGGRWNEAPCVFRHGDTYVMTYSARCFSDPQYSVGYATAPSPLGPWRKGPNNPILRRTVDVSGPGHNCVTLSPDGREMMILYHTHQSPAGGGLRQLAMDRLWVVPAAGGVAGGVAGALSSDAAGVGAPIRLLSDGPSHTPRPMPSRAGVREPAPLAKAG